MTSEASASTARPLLVEVGLSWPPETFIALKLTSLAERGMDVRVASFMSPTAPVPELEGILLERLPHWTEGRARKLLGVAGDLAALLIGERGRLRSFLAACPPRQAWRQRRLARWRLLLHLARLRADVIHFEWLTVASTCLPLLDVWDRPVVVSCRGSDLPVAAALSSMPPASALPALFARAAAVHCVAEAVRRDAVGLGLDPEKAWLIRGAVDAEFFRPAAEPRPPAGGFSVLSVGGLRWLKGHEYALLATAALVREGVPVTLDIVGGDPGPDQGEASQRARILHTADHLGVGDRVRLHGELEPAQVRTRLQRADVLLHSSLSEGLPNVVLEAMACGVPVVATDVGGTSEALRDRVEGFLVPPRDPGAAALALAALWRDRPLRRRMGQAGRARVAAQFTLERQTDQWIALYKRLAEDG